MLCRGLEVRICGVRESLARLFLRGSRGRSNPERHHQLLQLPNVSFALAVRCEKSGAVANASLRHGQNGAHSAPSVALLRRLLSMELPYTCACSLCRPPQLLTFSRTTEPMCPLLGMSSPAKVAYGRRQSTILHCHISAAEDSPVHSRSCARAGETGIYWER